MPEAYERYLRLSLAALIYVPVRPVGRGRRDRCARSNGGDRIDSSGSGSSAARRSGAVISPGVTAFCRSCGRPRWRAESRSASSRWPASPYAPSSRATHDDVRELARHRRAGCRRRRSRVPPRRSRSLAPSQPRATPTTSTPCWERMPTRRTGLHSSSAATRGLLASTRRAPAMLPGCSRTPSPASVRSADTTTRRARRRISHRSSTRAGDETGAAVSARASLCAPRAARLCQSRTDQAASAARRSRHDTASRGARTGGR